MKKNYIVMIAAALMTLVFVAGGYLYKSQQFQTQAELAKQNHEALIKPYSPRSGNPDAKVTIVEFMDPACETCRAFYPLVKKLIVEHKGRVNHVIRYAPLHEGSDYVLKILEASRKQGVYWPVLDLMFAAQPHWTSHHKAQPEVLWKYLEHYKFDVVRLKQDMIDPEIAKNIAQDLADSRQLGVSKTPSYFVNGKPLIKFGYEELRALIDAEITNAY
jgi:protein-disulfide isomerase